MAETVGSLVDKLSIVELKLYHMREQAERDDAAPGFREDCRRKLGILEAQRDDLAEELSGLLDAMAEGKRLPRVYRQFKMYNDPRYRTRSTAG